MSKQTTPFSVPFTLNKTPSENGDPFLLRCLKGELEFSFLSDESKEVIRSLELTEEKDDLRYLHPSLVYLWPLILTDALQELKKHDGREYDKANENMDSFFDPASLGTTELTDVLTGFSDFEGMLYGASPDRYRDHVAHSFRVWIIGHGVLQSCFLGKLSTSKGINISKNEWSAMWAIIALCHDIGYPLSHIEKINEKARTTLKKQGLLHEGNLSFNFSPQMLLFHDTIIRMMASVPVEKENEKDEDKEYYTHLQNKYYLKLLKSFDRLDHGIISSLLISRSLVYFLESDYSHDSRKSLDQDDIKQFFVRREILRAIAAHTCQDIYHLTFDNLSMLLYLIDEIQCWGRPTLEQSQHEPVDIREGYAEVSEFSSESISIKIITEDESWNDKQQKGVLFQVLKLRKMLRLAVERKDHTGNTLIFEVANQGEQKLRIEMKDRGLRLYHSNFKDKAIKAVPKLKNEIRKYSELESV